MTITLNDLAREFGLTPYHVWSILAYSAIWPTHDTVNGRCVSLYGNADDCRTSIRRCLKMMERLASLTELGTRYGRTAKQMTRAITLAGIKPVLKWGHVFYYKDDEAMKKAVAAYDPCHVNRRPARKDDNMFAPPVRNVLNPAFVRAHDTLLASVGKEIALRNGTKLKVLEVCDLFFVGYDGEKSAVYPITSLLAGKDLWVKPDDYGQLHTALKWFAKD